MSFLFKCTAGLTPFLIFLSSFLFFIICSAADKPCDARKYNHSSVVCVCNSTYCDDISQIKSPGNGKYIHYSSSMSGERFVKREGNLNQNIVIVRKKTDFLEWLDQFYPKAFGDTILKIRRNETFQTINGFGGAFTDAAGINIRSLSKKTQKKLINSYFSKNGLEYNMGRVPIGGCDFSTHPYAYNSEPENDIYLTNFSLSSEDYDYKIPLIKEASDAATSELYLIGSAWSPPIWMKTNHAYGSFSRLISGYYQTWADYHLKFLEEYSRSNITFWAITTGNEPSTGLIPFETFNSLGWLPSQQGLWVAKNLGPTIKNSAFSNVLILALDDQRFSLPWWIQLMAENENALNYIDGIAVHWYYDNFIPPDVVEKSKNLYMDKLIISTEACVGDRPWETEKVQLGSWERAESYIKDIVEDLSHWHVGWIDWNLALNRKGGPNWFNNFVDSPIIVLPKSDEFLKQPMFYALGHVSKFVPRGSKRVYVEKITGYIEHVAFLRPDGGIAVIFYNAFDSNEKVTIMEDNIGNIEIDVPPRSIHSVVYW